MSRKTIAVTVLTLTVVVSVAALVTSGPSGAAGKKYTIAFAYGQNGSVDVYHHAMERGGRAAAKALGVRYIATGSEADLESIFSSLIARHVDAIITDQYNPALRPTLAKVRAAGIPLLSNGDDIAGPRTVWVSYSDPVAYGEALADALASQTKGKGEYAIVKQQDEYPIADEWRRIVEKYVAKAYPAMKLDGVVVGTGAGDEAEIATLKAYIAAHPHLRGLIGVVPTEGWVEAMAITEAHLIGKVFSAGNGGGYFDREWMAPVRSGATEFVYASNPVNLGYLGVWAANYLATGHRFRPGAYQVGGPIGMVWYHAARQELRLGQPLTITKANVDVYANRF